MALVEGEPEAEQLERTIEVASHRTIAAPSVLEAMMVLSRLRGADSEPIVLATLAAFEIQVVAFDHSLLSDAFSAFMRFGKGRHRAALNFGDCFS